MLSGLRLLGLRAPRICEPLPFGLTAGSSARGSGCSGGLLGGRGVLWSSGPQHRCSCRRKAAARPSGVSWLGPPQAAGPPPFPFPESAQRLPKPPGFGQRTWACASQQLGDRPGERPPGGAPQQPGCLPLGSPAAAGEDLVSSGSFAGALERWIPELGPQSPVAAASFCSWHRSTALKLLHCVP